MFEFGLLGPLEVRADGRSVPLGGARPRAVFAVLALHANQPVSAERLAVALWGEDAPPSAVKTVQVYVARLRKALGDPDVLVTTPAGYYLRVRRGELDVEHFERLVGEGREALATGRADDAAATLREALELWRGPPLAELSATPFAPAEITRMEEQHLAAVEVRVEADLAAGRHGELVGELQRLTGEHPWRERMHAQLMLALYRSGRQADALEAYRHAREILVEQLGIEPSAELQAVHEAILAHDPALDAPPATNGRLSDGRGTRRTPLGAPGKGKLPAPPNETIGRERDLADLTERLRASSVRLITLTGPGGVGKTRLALEAARSVEADWADGARFVSLAAVPRPEDVPAAVVRALGIIGLEGESPSQAVERFLTPKHMLLVTDNFEHVLAAAPLIGDLLDVCPGLTVLATSREALNVRAERRYPVSPLALPQVGALDDARSLAGVDAVALFGERARARDPAFVLHDDNAVAVAEICRRVDGLPLAIELAAARCGLLAPEEIAERLDTALGLLGAGPRDAPARQQTLHATIDWSHELLGDEEQTCFARFAVFSGGATVEAAATVTGASLDTLDQLVAKSLLVRRQAGNAPGRLDMLETIRAYAAERFATAADDATVRERHYRYYLALAELHGTEQAICGGQNEHLHELDAEIENLRAALGWAVDRGTAHAALALCAALGEYWLMRIRYAEALDWIDRALGLPGAHADPTLRVRVLCTKAWTLWPLGRGEEQDGVTAEAEALARAVGDPGLLSLVLEARTIHASAHLGRLDVAERLAEEALHWASASADDWRIAMAAYVRAMAAQSPDEHRKRVDAAASLLAQAGNVYQVADLLASAAYSALCSGSIDDAREFISRAMPLAERLDAPFLAMLVRGNVALVSLLTGDLDAARHAFREELTLCRELVVVPIVAESLQGLAAVAAASGEFDRAARLLGASRRFGLEEDAVDAALKAKYFDPARSRNGADTWDVVSREGAALSFEDAIDLAFEESSV